MATIAEKVHDLSLDASDADYLRLTVDGRSYRIRWIDCSPRLALATHAERQSADASPSGYGLHWPLIDEDLAVDPLLEQAETLSD